jgi:hypothetical protein
MPRPRFAILLAWLMAWIGAAHGADAPSEASSGPSLGLSLSRADRNDAADLLPPGEGHAVSVRLQARWSEVEAVPGQYDWSSHDPAVTALDGAGYRVVLGLTGSHPHYLPGGEPPSPFEPEALEAWLEFVSSAVRRFSGSVETLWLEFVSSAVRRFSGSVETLEIWSTEPGSGDAPASTLFDAQSYAFLLKQSALEARGEAQALGSTIRVAQAAVRPDAMDWQRALWAADSAAYVDVLPISLEPGLDPVTTRAVIAELVRENVAHPPAAELWACVEPVGKAQIWAGASTAINSLSAGVDRAFSGVAGAGETRANQAAWLLGADRLLSSGYAPAPLGALRFTDGEGRPLESGRVLGRFFSADDFSSIIFYSLPGAADEIPSDRLVVDTSFVLNPRIIDPASGAERRVSSGPPPGDGVGRAIRVAAGEHPLVLLFEKPAAQDGFDLPPEEVETTRVRELTAEEIIARYQQVQEVQDEALDRWMATARIDFHFKFAVGGPTIDVGIDSNYFWERGGDVEWEQTGYYVQGNRVTWKNIPQIPFIQPAKVGTLPLDLTLDKTYRFRLVGRERVEGREAYVLEFSPADPDADRSLYRGRVWIDTETFVRVQANLIQTNLEPPVLSNEERDSYRAVAGADGRAFWLLDRIKGQQLWTVAGRNLVVQREVTFKSYQVNPAVAEFETRRQEAYASKNSMLRDTAKGFRYLERQEDGSRVVTEKMKTSQLFLALGAFKDNSIDGVAPIAGVNYFNYKLFGRDTQLNILFGGVVAFVNATKPSLFGTKMDLALDAVGVAIKTTDRVYAGDEELELERIRTRGSGLSLRLGLPAGQFAKFTLVGGVRWNSYYEDSDTQELYDAIRQDPEDPRDLRFVLPSNHTVFTGTFLAEYNRRGYSLIARMSHSNRSSWEEWGLRDEAIDSWLIFDQETGSYLAQSEAEPPKGEFSRWGVDLFKEWILPAFQKFRFELNYLDGQNLDRFSRYQFSLFGGDRLNGFSGSGLRFDRGGIARASYSFNVFEAVRFNADLERARVETKGSDVGFQSFTGVGLSGNVIGPWQTVISLSYGYALASDIPDLEGQQEFFLLILKLF